MQQKQLNSLIGSLGNRRANDFYPTPEYVTQVLLDNEKFDGSIWEPACGDGAMSRVIERYYPDKEVISSDIVDRGYGSQGDFLNTRTVFTKDWNIITNPPFNLATEFALHGLECVNKKVCMFNKLSFLEGKERRDKLFSQRKLEKVYVFSQRVTFVKDENQKNSGMLAFAWFVFNNEFSGDPIIKWI